QKTRCSMTDSKSTSNTSRPIPSSPFFPTYFSSPTPPPQIYTLSLHDALPISRAATDGQTHRRELGTRREPATAGDDDRGTNQKGDRKSTRLNSSHLVISYAVFCLKKKKQSYEPTTVYRQYAQIADFV